MGVLALQWPVGLPVARPGAISRGNGARDYSPDRAGCAAKIRTACGRRHAPGVNVSCGIARSGRGASPVARDRRPRHRAGAFLRRAGLAQFIIVPWDARSASQAASTCASELCSSPAADAPGKRRWDGTWLSYADAAVRLGVSPEAARRRAMRGKWSRMPGNDGRTRVLVPDEVRPPRAGDGRGTEQAREQSSVDALKSHIETLKERPGLCQQAEAEACVRPCRLG
jgi:hypothetical protein